MLVWIGWTIFIAGVLWIVSIIHDRLKDIANKMGRSTDILDKIESNTGTGKYHIHTIDDLHSKLDDLTSILHKIGSNTEKK